MFRELVNRDDRISVSTDDTFSGFLFSLALTTCHDCEVTSVSFLQLDPELFII